MNGFAPIYPIIVGVLIYAIGLTVNEISGNNAQRN